MNLKARIAKAIKDSGLKKSEIAERVGVSTAAVSQWASRDTKSLKSEVLVALARATGKSANWLATGAGPEEEPGAARLGKVPVIQFAALPVVASDECTSPATMATAWVLCPMEHGPRTFVYRVADDSMAAASGPKSYPPGCFVYVDPDRKDAQHDKPILARLPGGEVILANYMAQAGRVWLRLLNPAYPPVTGPFEVAGLVIFKGEEP